jgi:hypothetical protein
MSAAHRLEEFAIFSKCTKDFLRDLSRSDYVAHYNSNNLGILLSELERERFHPERVFTVANYTNLCRCVRELCMRMGAKAFTEAFPTWQYSLGEFRARTDTTIVHSASDTPQIAMQRLKNIADS